MLRRLQIAVLALAALVAVAQPASAQRFIHRRPVFVQPYWGPAWYGQGWYGPGWYHEFGPAYAFPPRPLTGEVKSSRESKAIPSMWTAVLRGLRANSNTLIWTLG